ncbi:MAG: hypothetical protein IKG56_03755 [Clostridia bacterium]|nr:hypothetical protein [Clostridia bacterium]
MGDRRVADRRAPEKGVIKIELKKFIVYAIVGTILLVSIILNIVLGILYSKLKAKYNNDYSLIETDSHDVFAANSYDTNESISSYYSEETQTCDLELVGNKTELKNGETITFEVKASNIEAGNGIVMFESLLDYDSSIINCEIETDDTMEWDKLGLVDKYVTLMRKDLQPSSENQTIAKITISAKENATKGQQTIKLKNVKFTTDNDSFFYSADKSISVNIK